MYSIYILHAVSVQDSLDILVLVITPQRRMLLVYNLNLLKAVGPRGEATDRRHEQKQWTEDMNRSNGQKT